MKKYLRQLVLAVAICFLFPQQSKGTGNDNPTGVTGEYNGSITTGGSYDPYTGNAKRFVTDLAVTGSLGAYPLKWTRALNTRGVAGIGFGHGGTWKHSYNWGLWVRPYRPWHYYPDPYEGPDGAVTYPDGRRKELNVEPEGMFYWLNEIAEPDDQLVPVGNGHFDLILADGGRVEFRHNFNQAPEGTYSLTARKIIDPHGLETILERDTSNRLKRITEPGGRYLEITYYTYSYQIYLNNETHTISTDVISKVEAFARPGQPTEKVLYHYEEENRGFTRFYNLIRADYDDLTHASYTYLPASAPPPHFTSLVPGRIETCDDPRYAGAMGKIEYVYAPYGNIHGPVTIGKIKGEKYPGAPTFVSEVIYPPYDPYTEDPPEYLRTERRGDGSTRTFQYSNNGDAELQHYTDFKGQSFSIGWPMVGGTEGGYVKTSTDALHRTTSIEKDNVTGAVLKITYHDQKFVLFDYHDPNDPAVNAHYLFSTTNERGKVTSYIRYPANHPNRHRVQQINYPDGGSETFTYNNFGQVLTHVMTNSGMEVFTYDSRGLKQTYTPPATSSDGNPGSHPTQYFYYQSGPHTDRLYYVVDPRGNATWYEYNGRGQVTKVTHQDGTYTQSGYNGDGTLAWTADENHPGAVNDPNQRTRYEYDEYKRVTRVTNPLNESVNNSYAPWSGHGPLSHTTSSVYRTTSHLGRKTDHEYDENFRRLWTKQASETQDEALTQFTYDSVGNLETTTDPRVHVTRFGYDDRNRQTSVKNEALNETTEFRYDDAGNRIRETRPDGVFRTWRYDEMNRVSHAYDWRLNEDPRPDQTTTYDRDHAGNPLFITDAKGAIYKYEYDELGRKKKATFPIDATGLERTESWLYDFAGNLKVYKNPADQFKHFEYDERNRQRRAYWNGSELSETPNWNVGAETTTTLDYASRVTEVRTNGGETVVGFEYDHANRKLWEDQTVAGHPTRRVKTDLDGDGKRENLQIVNPPQEGGGIIGSPEMAGTGVYSIAYEYTYRNQLKKISGEDWDFEYFYDPSGNMTRRQAQYNGRSSATHCPTESYDALNRPANWEQTGPNGFYALSHHQYDRANREKATWRTEENNRGELFQYELTNQLKEVVYNVAISPTPSPSPTPPPNGTPTPTVPPSQQVAEPAFDPDGGFWGTTQPRTVTVTTATTGASMRYTFGDTLPTATSGTPIGSGETVSVIPTEDGTILNVIAFKDGLSDSEVHTATYYYGGLGPGAGARIVTYAYTADKLNRSSVNDSANEQTRSFTPNQLNQYTNVGGIDYTYDNKFNLTGAGGFGGVYDAANRLVSAWNSAMAAQAEVELVYDGLGRCVKRTIGGVATIIIYDEWKPIAEWDGWTEEYFQAWNVYGPGADEILLRHSGKYGYTRYHSDPHGNVKFLLDNDGQLVEKYTYDAFGRPKITDAYGNPRDLTWWDNRFLFQGREYIAEIGIYDYRNRFYHPDLGRFLQVDPTGFDAGDMNLFRYCGDDPIDGSDPTGLQDSRWATLMWWQSGSKKSLDETLSPTQPAGITMATITLNKGKSESSLKRMFSPNYPDKGPGGRAVVDRALKVLRSKPHGRFLLRGKGVLTIKPTDKNNPTGIKGVRGDLRLYLNPNDPLFYDPETYRKIYKDNPGERPPISDEGRASVIGHELGHRFEEFDEDMGGRNVRVHENAVRKEHDLPLRRSYGGHQFPVDE